MRAGLDAGVGELGGWVTQMGHYGVSRLNREESGLWDVAGWPADPSAVCSGIDEGDREWESAELPSLRRTAVRRRWAGPAR